MPPAEQFLFKRVFEGVLDMHKSYFVEYQLTGKNPPVDGFMVKIYFDEEGDRDLVTDTTRLQLYLNEKYSNEPSMQSPFRQPELMFYLEEDCLAVFLKADNC